MPTLCWGNIIFAVASRSQKKCGRNKTNCSVVDATYLFGGLTRVQGWKYPDFTSFADFVDCAGALVRIHTFHPVLKSVLKWTFCRLPGSTLPHQPLINEGLDGWKAQNNKSLRDEQTRNPTNHWPNQEPLRKFEGNLLNWQVSKSKWQRWFRTK